MDRNIVQGGWRHLKGKVKARSAKLTCNRLEAIDGKRVELSGKLQEGDGSTKATAQQILRLE